MIIIISLHASLSKVLFTLSTKYDICHVMPERFNPPACSVCGAKEKSVFCSLSSAQLDEVDQVKGGQIYKKGEVIFKEGSYSRGLFCLSKGKVKLSRLGSSGREQIVRFATVGDVIGYNSMLSKKPLSASAYVIEEAAICFIPADTFFNMIKAEPKFSLEMLQLTAKNWDTASRLVTDMAQKTSIQRLAEMLLWLKETFGLDEDNCIDIQLSREEIASMVGTATEAVIRLLRNLKEKKLIDLEGKKIKLLDIHGLVMIADILD